MPTKMKGEQVGDDADFDARANELAQTRPRPRARQEEKPEREEPERETPAREEGVVEIELDDEDDDGDDEQEEQSTRRERRRERGALRRENDELRERLARLEGQMARPVVQQQAPAPQQQNQPDPYEQELESIFTQAEQLEARARQLSARKDAAGNVVGMTDEEIRNHRRQWAELEQRKTNVMVARANAGRPQSNDPRAVALSIVQAEYGDVFQSQQALVWADGRRAQLNAEGKPNNLALWREVLDAARTRFRTAPGTSRPVTEQRKAKYSGVSRGGGSAADGERPRVVALTKQQQAMAEDRWPSLPAKDAHKRYAKEILGKRRQSA